MLTTPNYLYKIQPVRTEMLKEGLSPEEERIISEHFAYLKGLSEQGIVFLAGRTLNTDESSFGIVIFYASSLEEAHRIMDNDPAVRQQVMKAKCFPYQISLLRNDDKLD